MNAPMEQIQDDVFGRIDADTALADIVVLEERRGVLANDIAQTLGSQTTRGGKKGACIVIMMPVFTVTEPNAVGPRVNVSLTVQCIEKPLINRGPGGAGVTGEDIAIRVLQLLHHFIVANIPVTLNARGVEAVIYETGEREFNVHFGSMLQLTCVGKPAAPVISGSIAAGLSITGPANCQVWYTIDGSYPSPENAAAILLGSPADLLSQQNEEILGEDNDPISSQGIGQLISGGIARAVAYPNDPTQQASNVAYLTLT